MAPCPMPAALASGALASGRLERRWRLTRADPWASGPRLPRGRIAQTGRSRAQMAELVDAPSSGGGARKGVEVRVLFWAPFPGFLILTIGGLCALGSRLLRLVILEGGVLAGWCRARRDGCPIVFAPYLGHKERNIHAARLKAELEPRAAAGPKEHLDNVILEIVILAMVAGFLGLRLYSVLGRRAEHEEEQPIPTRFERPDEVTEDRRPVMPAVASKRREAVEANEAGVRAIAAADPRFDLGAFLEGAKGAYRMILEAFWQGDRETLRELCDAEVYNQFAAAIDAREAAGETLDNKLIRIEDATVRSAAVEGRTARIAVLFVADIAAVTRDKDGVVIAGSLDDAVESRDVWTFARHLDSSSPDWKLEETDEG
jgi:predicted lipid-binding transport protein (Tim44 family)